MGTNATANCPGQKNLLSLLNETMADETVALHVSTCEYCQSELDRLTDSDGLVEYRKALSKRNDVSRHFGAPLRSGDMGSLDELAIERQIGSGGMGDVFQARDQQLGRSVAVKILSRSHSHEADARFVREAKSAAKLRHDNVVSIFSTGRTSEGTPYLVMPLIEGLSLKERIARGKLDMSESTDWIRQVALGLESAHELGMIHRDVKPANIMLDDSDGRAKLTDFGLARSLGDETLTQADVLTGTPYYMSPEQANGAVNLSASTDIYSLGITLYEVLTGAPPFQGQPLQVLEQHRSTNPLRPSSLNSDIPQHLETICLKAIAKPSAARYLSMAEFADDLQRFSEGRPILARETTNWEKLTMWCGRNRGIAALGATSVLLLLALVAGTSFSAWQLSQANEQIIEEKDNATRAGEFAINDRNAAIEALEKVVDSLYDELSDNASSIKTREAVVAAAIEGLQAITSVEGDLKSDRTSMKAFRRIGDLCFLKGAQDQAEENYEQAILLARSLVNQQPDEVLAKRELGMVLSELSGHYIHTGSPKYEEPFNESRELLTEVLAANPNDFDALVRLVGQHVQQLRQIRRLDIDKPQKVIDFGESILDDVETLFEIKNDNRSACESAHTIHFCIGRGYLEAGNPTEASKHFSAARPYLDVALSQASRSASLQTASAILDRAHAMVLQSEAELEDAIQLFESSLDTLLEMAINDPDNIATKQHIANTQFIMSVAYAEIGRYDEAISTLEKATDVYRILIDSFPDNDMPRVLRMQAQFQLASIFFIREQFSECLADCESIQTEFKRKEFASNFEEGADYYTESAAIMQEAANSLSENQPAQKTVSGQCLALLLAIRLDANEAETDSLSSETKELMIEIESEFEGSTFGDFYEYVHQVEDLHDFVDGQRNIGEAIAFGFLAKNASGASAEDAGEISSQFLTRSIAAIKKVAANASNGELKSSVLNNVELTWVRGTEEFRKFWDELNDSPERQKQ